MKRFILSLAATVSVLGLVLLPAVVSAQVMGNDKDSHVRANQTIDDDLYIKGEDVIIEGTVNGDVYAAGSNIIVRGTVNGDVLAVGQDILISGSVTGSVRAAAQSVRLSSATIDGSVSDASKSFTVEKDTSIGGGLNFAAKTASVQGSVKRGIVGGGSEITLSNNVGKDVILGGSDITLGPGANIAGALTYYGSAELHKNGDAKVQGETKHIQKHPGRQHSEHQAEAVGIIWGIVSLYAVGAALIWLGHGFLPSVAQTITRRPWPSLGFGALALVLTLPIVIILLITVIGVPLALILGLAFAVSIYLAKLFVSLTVGTLIAGRTGWRPNPYADTLIGLLLITLLELVPVIGGLVKLAVLLLGLGGLVLYLHSQHRRRPAKGKPVAA